MNRLELIKSVYDFLKSQSLSDQELVNYLMSRGDLDISDKTILMELTRTRQIVGDRELPSLLNNCGQYPPLAIMIRACRSEQYHRFFVHLYFSFFLNRDKIHYVDKMNTPNGTFCCPITGETLIDNSNNKDPQKQYVGITNNQQTNMVVSPKGLGLLIELFNLLDYLDKDFLKKHQ